MLKEKWGTAKLLSELKVMGMERSSPARGFGYTLSWVFFTKVFGIVFAKMWV